jgi:hypothetical protein
VGDAEDFSEGYFVFIDPRHGWETSACSMDALWKMLLKDDGDKPGQKALDEIEDIVDGRTYFSDRLEDVAVKNHLPLDSALGREKGTGMDGEVELVLGTGWEADRGAPY